MGNIRSVLKELYGIRDEYSEEEVCVARRVLAASVRSTPRSSRFPSVFVPVGGYYTSAGVRYRCVLRPRGIVPRDCCRGCAFDAPGMSCPAALQCSKHDRSDHRFVWFVREDS